MQASTIHRPRGLLTKEQVLELLKAEVDRAGSQRKWAMDHALSNTVVSETLSEKREPGNTILTILGLKRAESYYVPL